MQLHAESSLPLTPPATQVSGRARSRYPMPWIGRLHGGVLPSWDYAFEKGRKSPPSTCSLAQYCGSGQCCPPPSINLGFNQCRPSAPPTYWIAERSAYVPRKRALTLSNVKESACLATHRHRRGHRSVQPGWLHRNAGMCPMSPPPLLRRACRRSDTCPSGYWSYLAILHLV